MFARVPGNTEIASKSEFYGFSRIKTVDFSKNFDLVGTGSSFGSVVWDSTKERIKYTFAGNTKKVLFNPDATQLLTVTQVEEPKSIYSLVSLYDLQDGTLRQQWSEFDLPIFSLDGSELALVKNNILNLVSPATGKLLDSFSFAAKITNIAFAPGDRDLAVGTEAGMVHIYNLASRQITKSYTGKSSVTGIKFIPQNSWLFVSREAEKVEAISLLTGEIVSNLPDSFSHKMNVNHNLDVNSTGDILSCVINRNLEIYKLPEFIKLPASEYVWVTDMSPDDKYIAIGAADYRSKRNGVKLVNPKNLIQVTKLNMGFDDVVNVAFSQDGTKLLAYGYQTFPSISTYNHTIQIWDLKTLKPLSVLDGYLGGDFISAISPQQKLIVASDKYSIDTNIFVWNFATGMRIAHFNLNRSPSKNRKYEIQDLKFYFSRDEKQLAVETTVFELNSTDKSGKRLFSVFSLPQETLIGEFEKLPHNFSSSPKDLLQFYEIRDSLK